MRDELKAVERAATRCERALGRIARRNARRAFVGAWMSLRTALDREYPAIPKAPRKPLEFEAWVNPTEPARQVWAFLFDEPWPARGRVEWVGFMRGAVGLCCGSGTRFRIALSYGDLRIYLKGKRDESYGPVGVLVHEFLHARGYRRHNREFKDAERKLLARMGLEVNP